MTAHRDIAAIVVTDMVSSTALRVRLGDERADRLRRIHDRLLTARVEANRGRVLRYQGDGLVAVFPSASQALSAAVEIQQAAASYSRRPDALAQIALRVGVSVGEVSFEDHDCFGIPMVEAARLEAAAGPGRILCSELARVMARGRDQHRFRSLGFLELKGLPDPLAAWEVAWEPEPDQPPFPLPPELRLEASTPFVGRALELHTAEAFAGLSGRIRLSVLWLLGEPGIGKTRLATEIARRAHSKGGVVLFGRCSEDVATPYEPFLQALRWYVPLVPDTEIGDRLGNAPQELLRLNPFIRSRLPSLELPADGLGSTGRYRLYESVRTWLSSAGGGRPVVMVLDDLHWATRPTLAMLGQVARSAENSRILLVCTIRNTAPDDNPALAALMEELDRRGTPNRRIELAGLSAEALEGLVEVVTGSTPGRRRASLAQALYDETAGNPLYADSLLRSAAADPGGSTGGGLTATLSQRVARLPPQVGDVLRAAAVAGPDFGIPVLAQVTGLSEVTVLGCLESAEAAGLVAEQAANVYRFRHALLRRALGSGVSESRRVRMHLMVADALEALHASDVADHAAAIAFHLVEALPLGTAERAYRFLLLSADQATRLLAHDEAVEAYRKAMELADRFELAGAEGRFDLLWAKSTAERKSGDMVGALETLRRAIDEAASGGIREARIRAAVAFEETLFWLGRGGDEAISLLEPAIAELPPGDFPARALALATMSRALSTSGRPSGTWTEQAAGVARRVADPATSFAVAFRTTDSAVSVEHAELSRDRWARLSSDARRFGDQEAHLLGLSQVFWASAMTGDVSAADDLIEDYARSAGPLRQPRWDYWLNLMRSFRAALKGDLQSAERYLETAEQIGEGFGWAREGLYGISMFLFRREQGRLSEVAPLMRAASRLDSQNEMWRPGLAALHLELGQRDEARAAYEEVISQGAGNRGEASPELALALTAEVCAALGDVERATVLVNRLRPCRGKFLAFLGCSAGLGPADRLLGMLASTAGRAEDAERWHRSSLELARHMNSPLWVAHCLHDYGEHQVRFGMTEGLELLQQSSQLCAEFGLLGLGSRVEKSLESSLL